MKLIHTLILLTPYFLLLAFRPAQNLMKETIYKTSYDVRDYGAKGDGISTDNESINKAIDAASAAGGGTVYFPAGTYLSFSIRLKNNISLYIDQGATILAADPSAGKDGFDPAEPNESDKFQDFGHSHWQNSLIWGIGLENISIFGPGMINGKGLTREAIKTPGVANKAISLKLCRNVILRDFSILMGGHFAILATAVDNLTVNNLKIDTNRDGIDIDCCKNVRVSDCSVNSPWDDAICLKSSYALGYARATENVTITNCMVSGFDRGSLMNGTNRRLEGNSTVPDHAGVTGRIKFGTESNGGFKNVTISNCVFEFCRGLALETVDGGLLEDITITNITMRDIVSSPIFLRLGARMRGPAGTPVGSLRRVIISNINVYNADPKYAALISGIPGHNIEDVKMDNIRIIYQGGGTKEQSSRQLPENEKDYPDPVMFGTTPAYGFYIRHVAGLEMNNIDISYMKDDLRPAFILNDVKDARFSRMKIQRAPVTAAFVLSNVNNFAITESGLIPDNRFTGIINREIK